MCMLNLEMELKARYWNNLLCYDGYVRPSLNSAIPVFSSVQNKIGKQE